MLKGLATRSLRQLADARVLGRERSSVTRLFV